MDGDHKVISRRIKRLVREHGSRHAVGYTLGIDTPYLMHLENGTKKNPGDEILSKLGLKRVFKYVPIARKMNGKSKRRRPAGNRS
jgi:hypothetical protein